MLLLGFARVSDESVWVVDGADCAKSNPMKKAVQIAEYYSKTVSLLLVLMCEVMSGISFPFQEAMCAICFMSGDVSFVRAADDNH